MKKNSDPIGDLIIAISKMIGSIILFLFRTLKSLVLLIFGKRTVSEKQKKKLQYEFEKIALKDKAGNYPTLVSYTYDKKIPAHQYIFRSSIPLEDWERSRQGLSTAIDKNIHSIDEYGSKQRIKIVATDNSVRLPESLPFKWEEMIDDDVTFVVGQNTLKAKRTFNILSTPHLLVAGGTGSGKSVFLQSIVGQALWKGWKLDFIDFKKVEFNSSFEKYGEVASNYKGAHTILKRFYEENDARMELFEREGVRNISEYNEKYPNDPIAFSAVVIDEIAELLDVLKSPSKDDKKNTDESAVFLASLSRLGRAQGVYIFMAMQRPEGKILPLQIRDQMNVRLAGYLPSAQGYRMVLGDEASMVRQRSFMTNSWAEKYEKNKLDDSYIDVSEVKIVPGRLAFLAGSIPEMIQGYYYKPDVHGNKDFKVKGKMLKSTVTNSRASKEAVTVPVNATPKVKVPVEVEPEVPSEMIFDFENIENGGNEHE